MSHKHKDIFDINELDLAKLCKAFGYNKPPFTNLNIKPPTSSMKRKKEYSSNKEKFYSSGKEKNNNKNYTY